MHRRFIVPSAIAASLLLAIPASAAEGTVGAPGIGDPYYPASGNGGYDVSHYDLRLKYQPSTDLLEGTATILATTTQELSRFNLDFGLEVSEVRVDGKKAGHVKNGEQGWRSPRPLRWRRADPSRWSCGTPGSPPR